MNGAPGCVTVLLPLFNGARYLHEAVESILAQTWAEFRLLIIDDGSTDNSLEVARGFKDARIEVLENDENLGLIKTLNKGLDLADGEFIARMDQDDIALPERFERQIAYMQKHTSVGVCGTWATTFGQRGEKVWTYPATHEEIRVRLLFASALAHPSVMLRRNLLEGLRYRADYLHAEDYRFWVDATAKAKLANLPVPLLRYRFHSEQVGWRNAEQQVETANRIRREQLAGMGLDPTPEEMETHISIGLDRSGFSMERLVRAEKWLLQVHEANERSLNYPVDVLRSTFATYWWEACLLSACQISEAWRIFRNSPIARWRPVSIMDWGRFAKGRFIAARSGAH